MGEFVNSWDSRSLCLHQPQSPLAFTARSLGDSSSCHWNPGLAAGPRVGLGSLAPQGTRAAAMSLLIFNRRVWVWDQPVLYVCPSCMAVSAHPSLGRPFSWPQAVLDHGCSVV